MTEIPIPYNLIKFSCMSKSPNTPCFHLWVKAGKITNLSDYSPRRSSKQCAKIFHKLLSRRKMPKRIPTILIEYYCNLFFCPIVAIPCHLFLLFRYHFELPNNYFTVTH